jgi:hypothetical protein
MAKLKILNYTLKHFDLSVKSTMEQYLSKLKIDVSDYTFAANYIWFSSASGFYAIIDDTFCIFIMTGSELSMPLPPIGTKENVHKAIISCFNIMNENNTSKYYSKIEYVDESMLEGFVNYLEEGTFIFEALLDYIVEKKLVDYIYKADDLIDLKGNAYHSKRNEINKFKKAYPNHEIILIDPDEHAQEIINLFNKWVADRIKYMPKEEADIFLEGIFQERLAIKRMLQYYNKLELVGLIIRIDGECKGFTVGEKINETTGSVIIEKTDFEILGCAQFIFREFSKILKNQFDIQYINVGDDMGFENLKKVKMSYRPYKLLPKYTIYQK